MSEGHSTELTNTAYDILKVLGKDADFLYDTIDKYIKDAQNANRQDLIEMWQVIKKDRQKHVHMLKEIIKNCKIRHNEVLIENKTNLFCIEIKFLSIRSLIFTIVLLEQPSE